MGFAIVSPMQPEYLGPRFVYSGLGALGPGPHGFAFLHKDPSLDISISCNPLSKPCPAEAQGTLHPKNTQYPK